MLREAGLGPPLESYPTRDNVDWRHRQLDTFAGLPVTTFQSSRMVDVGPLALARSTLQGSANGSLPIGH
jgi:hypothetical protein